MRRPPPSHDRGPTAALVAAAAAAVAGVVVGILFLHVGVPAAPGLLAGGVLAVLLAVAYTRVRADEAADVALAVLAAAAFYIVLFIVLVILQALLGGVVHD